MKLPNGFGSVYKLSGNRRRPYIARKTVDWDDEGRQLYQTIGYYPSKTDALQALAAFNDDPYDLAMSKTTFAEIYKRWSDSAFDSLGASAIRNYTTPYKACSDLYAMPIGNIRTHHMQRVIDGSGKNPQSMRRIRILFNQLFRCCRERRYVKKNYAEFLKIPSADDPPEEKKPFSVEEIQILWDNIANNEYVPLADKVLPFCQGFMSRSQCDYAVSTLDGERHLSYDNFKKRYWFPLMGQLNMKHLPHETRHTCISRLVVAGVNQTVIKKIVGHKSIMNLTEKVLHPY